MMPGSQIAHYRITSKLGEGGMGAVYLATDTKLNRDVAIKVLPPAFAEDVSRMQRFLREAQVLASLNHPNIATIYGIEAGALVMELVEGHELTGPLPVDTAISYARQIAAGLEAAHEKGIIHRDLKPANIKVTSDGTVKLLDFGLAKAAEQNSFSASATVSPTLSLAMTQAGMILGTAAYMSPEQARGYPVDRRADIWAFGVVLYEMLTGRLLFGGGETVTDTLASVVKDTPDLGALPAATPANVRRLLERCLRKDPKLRLRDIGDARLAFDEPPDTAVTPAALPPPGRRSWLLAALLAAAIPIAAAGWWRATRSPDVVPSMKLSVLAPEKASFVANSVPSLSPDGKRLAFAAMSEGKTQLWIRDLNALEGRPLAGSDGASFPFWSPDNRFLAFFADGKLKKVDAAGGPPLTICDASQPRGGAWNQNDVIIFTPSFGSPLLRVPASGGAAPVPLTSLDAAAGENSHRFPWFLPDGRHYLFTVRNGEPDKSGVYLGDLESKERRRVIAASSNAVYSPPGYLLFVRDQNLMAIPFDLSRFAVTGDPIPIAEQVDYVSVNIQGQFAVSGAGMVAYNGGGIAFNDQLTWFDRAGKPIATVGRPGAMVYPAISPDGNTVAVDRLDPRTGNYDIWLNDLLHGTDSRLTFDPRSARQPLWSPDGKRILYTSLRSAKTGLYLKSATGSGNEEFLVDMVATPYGTDWARDGRNIFFASTDLKTRSDVWVFPVTGDRKPYPFLQTEYSEGFGKLSPDGRWLAYQSRETGITEVYVQTFPGKEGKWQISPKGGDRPVWSRDGKELFYLSPDSTLMSVDVRSGASFEFGIPKPLFRARTPALASFDVSPDGKRFLIVTQEQASGTLPMTMMVNWQAGLKK